MEKLIDDVNCDQMTLPTITAAVVWFTCAHSVYITNNKRIAPMARSQVIGNVGMYYAAYRLSQMGWNVMPTSRNARGIDLLAYDAPAGHYLGVQVKALSKILDVSLGQSIDHLMGDWGIIVTNAATTPECFIMTPDEVRRLAYREKDNSHWLKKNLYRAKEFHEAWHRIGRGDSLTAIETDLGSDSATKEHLPK